jgi:hypothetical protein
MEHFYYVQKKYSLEDFGVPYFLYHATLYYKWLTQKHNF